MSAVVKVDSSPEALAAAYELCKKTTLQEVVDKVLDGKNAAHVCDAVHRIPDWESSALPELEKIASDASLDPISRLVAAQVLLKVGAMDAEAAIFPLLGHADPFVRREMLETIGETNFTSALPHVTSLLEDDDLQVRNAAKRVLGELRGEGPMETPLASHEALLQRKDVGSAQYWWAVVEFARKATAAHLPMLRSLYIEQAQKERNGDEWVVAPCLLAALARLQGAVAIQADLIDALAGSDRLSMQSARIIGTISSDQVEDRTLSALRGAIRQAQESYRLEMYAWALCLAGGPGARPGIRRDVEDVMRLLESRMDSSGMLSWAMRGITMENALEKLESIGVIKAVPPDELTSWEAKDDWGPPTTDLLLDFLGSQRVVFTFDVEAGIVPVPHHELLLPLSAISNGRFVPEAVTQEWLQASPNEEAPYRLTFISDNRVYSVECAYKRDWYDVSSVLAAANRAVADSGARERFVSLDRTDQCASIIFCRPELIARAALEGLLSAEFDESNPTARKDTSHSE